MTEQPRLHHLLDRLRHGVLLEAEREQLVGLVGELKAENAKLRDGLARCRHKPRVTELEAEVTRLTAGQCTHTVPDRTTLPDLHQRIVEALAVAYPDPAFNADDLGHLVLAVRDGHIERLEQQLADADKDAAEAREHTERTCE
jgi:hypothetical protein